MLNERVSGVGEGGAIAPDGTIYLVDRSKGTIKGLSPCPGLEPEWTVEVPLGERELVAVGGGGTVIAVARREGSIHVIRR